MDASPKETERALSLAAKRLIKGDQPGWEEFMHFLAIRLEIITEALVTSPPERLAEMQGQAKEARALFRLLHNAPKVDDLTQQRAPSNVTGPRAQP